MKNMKRQGVRRSNDELGNAETSDCKRIKLLNSDSDNGSVQDGKETESTESMNSTPSDNDSSHYNHEDHAMPVLTQNGSDEIHVSNKFSDKLTQPNQEDPPHINGNGTIDELETNNQNRNELVNNYQSSDEPVNENDVQMNKIDNNDVLMNKNKNNDELMSDNQNSHELVINNQNGSCDEVVLRVSSTQSGIVSELYYSDSQSTSVPNSEKDSSVESKSMPVLSNYENQDIDNSESTDSFQSESFDAMKSSEFKNKESEPCSSQEKDKSPNVISDSKSGLMKSFDVDNLTLSHLEVTRLEGHSDTVLSVAADEDFVLSSSADTTVKVWSTIDNSLICNFSGHSDSVTSLLLLNQKQTDVLQKKLQLPEVSRIAITGSTDCHIKLWSIFEGKELLSIYTFNGIACLGYLESEQLIVVGTEGGKLELWDVCTSKAKQSVHAHEECVFGIKVHDCNIYSVSTDGLVKIWLFEDDEMYPVYTRKRKERSLKEEELCPTEWRAVAVSDNIMYLGDRTNCVKVLDSTAGRLRLFRNQEGEEGICECVASDKNFILTSFYDSSSDTGGINVWRIPDMTYVCTLSGEVQEVYSLAIVKQANSLRIVSGGNQLLVWDFDFSRAPNKEFQASFEVTELESVGQEIFENLVAGKNMGAGKKSLVTNSCENNKRWCNVM